MSWGRDREMYLKTLGQKLSLADPVLITELGINHCTMYPSLQSVLNTAHTTQTLLFQSEFAGLSKAP